MMTIKEILPDVKLRFNLDHPSYEDCYAFGYECAQSGIDEQENPFCEGSSEFEQWIDGWWAGFYGEEPIFEVSPSQEPAIQQAVIAANDSKYVEEKKTSFIMKVLELSGVIAVSAILGYQVIDLVA